MIFVKPAKFLEPLAQGPLTGWRRPIWSKRSSGSGRVCLNLLLLWKCRQRGLLFTLQTFNSLALIRSWPTVKWPEQGPLGKDPASTLHVSNLGVFVCVWVSERENFCVCAFAELSTWSTANLPRNLKSSATWFWKNKTKNPTTVNLKVKEFPSVHFWLP